MRSKNPNIAKHYASLQSGNRRSAYGGQGTPQGQLKSTIPFAQQRLAARLRSSKALLGDAVRNNQALTPGQLLTGVESGRNIRNIADKQLSEARIEANRIQQQRELLNAENALARVRRQTQQLARETEDKSVSRARALTDAKFDGVAFPTQKQQNLKASTDIQRQKSDTLRDFRRELVDAQRAVDEANKFIENSNNALAQETDSNRKNVLLVGIEESKKVREIKLKEIEEINQKIAESSKAFDAKEKARFERTNFEEYLRSSKATIDLQTQENAVLQEQIAQLEKIKDIYPNDARTKELPALQEKLSLNQLEIETATKLLDIEEQIQKSGNDEKIVSELEKQLELLEKQNDVKLKNITLVRQQQQEELSRGEHLRSLNIDSRFAEFSSQLAENSIRRFERSNSKNAFGIDTRELTKARYEFLNIQETLNSIDLRKQIQDVEDFAKENDLTSQQLSELINSVEQLNQTKLTNIRQEFEELISTDRLNELKKVRENLETEFNLLQQPRINLGNAKADSYEAKGGNVFVANEMRRRLGTEQELFNRDNSIRQLNEQVLEARNRGIKITDTQVEGLRNNILEMSEINLDNLNNQFKNVATTLGDITKTGLREFSSGLADLIVKGGSLDDVFDNLFGNILNSVINMGLNSLLGGLFGGIGLFYKGQAPNYAKGSIPSYSSGGIHKSTLDKALLKERVMSGRKPQLAVVHENELIIPADRTQQLANLGFSPEALLGKVNNFSNGYAPKLAKNNQENIIQVKSEIINEKEYVDMQQLQAAMQQAAKKGAEDGMRKVQVRLQQSTTFRSSVGI